MTRVKRVVELTPPEWNEREQHLESKDMECGYCHGQGEFVYEERWGTDVLKICPICQGRGRVDAEITVRWKPSERRNTNNPTIK